METIKLGHIEMNIKAVKKMTKKKFVKLYKDKLPNAVASYEELQMKLGKK